MDIIFGSEIDSLPVDACLSSKQIGLIWPFYQLESRLDRRSFVRNQLKFLVVSCWNNSLHTVPHWEAG